MIISDLFSLAVEIVPIPSHSLPAFLSSLVEKGCF
ncbi:hypothetical protein BACUNI_01479 [Bacteroides uniformis ATCC 8492]|uniref:Uncharacterized protein n=1 Tax=Bacteroides uniformis (strain ATCC 8492 / DSM 6597 / CCUG 4942 / CIP 103695 / JCM 5828 / KCTC 5204 / NCTC 13054 / VPI 0061) TaxID=411479 RepID=A0ABC9NDU0_BACUC|nr:hypothetical protein BACUNI_01479 [Bacteroides uniformis ATCC 8492]